MDKNIILESKQQNLSVLGKIWQQRTIDEQFASNIRTQLDVSDFLSRLLSYRVSDIHAVEKFLNPKIKDYLPDPFHLKDMEKGVERLIKAIKEKEKITIFADYDVDGATSSALISNVLEEIGIKANIYVPDRIKEGYGPTIEGMHNIKNNGSTLVITVDCGSVAFEALKEAANIGLDVIVIDHHISLDSLPKAIAVINPNRLDENSNCKNLAAVGVSFLFMVGLISRLKQINYFGTNKKIPDLIRQLDIVALGTVCDVMKLTGLNRAYVSQGIKVARQRQNIGYSALCDIAGLEEAINSYHLGFIIGPRINAGGRVGKSSLGAQLLSTNSTNIAQQIALELDIHNNDRKAIEILMIEEATRSVEDQIGNPLLFAVGEGWHPGVIGIVAGRLKEKYNLPIAVIALNDGIAKASCRSVAGVDFGAALLVAKSKGLLEAGGGHAMAAGFTAKQEKLEDLREFLACRFAKELSLCDDRLVAIYDQNLTTSAVSIELIQEISRLEPFGVGNSTPIFRFDNLYVLKADIVGAKHIRVVFAPSYGAYKGQASRSTLQAISFGSVSTPMENVLLSKKAMDMSVFGTLSINRFQGYETVQLQIKDIMIER